MKRINIILMLLIAAQLCFGQYEPKAKGELVKHTYYTLDYNEKHEQASWVYYKLTKESVNGAAERKDNFRADNKVKTGSASLADYKKSGYDRGHLCPAADMKLNATAMSESFYMSNMSPQAPSLNRGGWKKLEEQVRSWSKKYGTIYVVTGPVLTNPKTSIGTNKVSVPTHYYKIVYDPSEQKMIAFLMPNEKLSKNITGYIVTVDEVEKLSGIDFFYQLDDKLENDLEGKLGGYYWPFHTANGGPILKK